MPRTLLSTVCNQLKKTPSHYVLVVTFPKIFFSNLNTAGEGQHETSEGGVVAATLHRGCPTRGLRTHGRSGGSGEMLNSHGYVLDKKDLPADKLAMVKKDLNVRADWNPETSYGPPPPRFRVYLESPTAVCVPTHYGQTHFGPAKRTAWNKVVPAPRLVFVGKLKEETRQQESVAAALEACAVHGGGILSLPTGFGKVSCSLQKRVVFRFRVDGQEVVLQRRVRRELEHRPPGDLERRQLLRGLDRPVVGGVAPEDALFVHRVDSEHRGSSLHYELLLQRGAHGLSGLSATGGL